MIKEFRDFINRGNVVDLAVAVILGAAFTAIVQSLVNNLINPLIGLFLGKVNLSSLQFSVGSAAFKYGSFIESIVNFLIVAFVVFLMVKLINKASKKKEEVAEPSKEDEMVEYLKDISLSLKNKKD
ncbi:MULTISPECIES: large-conductance mechanosensitive channel protein MscL [Lactobacillaceae]|uniref:large-conductance mechanosensitive channel protein MscL n=1 Tax=Lactobacillaceae TaxID=33958 RepID=UPI000C1B6BE8|nr:MULTISPECIES: large-conductance mechanosensitive channel protein MscL [Lactobacillaceae]